MRIYLVVENNAHFYLLSRVTKTDRGTSFVTLKSSVSIQEVQDYIETNHPGETVIFRITPKTKNK